MLRIYGDPISGNCQKVKWAADYLKLPYEWIDIDIMKGESRTPEYLAINSWGQVPAVVLDDGRSLAQSNAIVLHLAEGSDLIPTDPYDRARMMEWLYWEQYSHETAVAVQRFQVRYLGRDPAELDPKLVARSKAALKHLDEALSGRAWLVGETMTCADLCLLPYSRMAPEGGLELSPYTALKAWIARTSSALEV
jgi:glutathione S-transferase